MPDLAAWPDVHDVVRLALQELGAVYGPRIPNRLQELMPLYRVRRAGGGPVGRFTDQPRVDLETYAATYPVARDLAQAAVQHLTNTPIVTSAGKIDAASVDNGPLEVPYADPDTRLILVTYRLSLRR